MTSLPPSSPSAVRLRAIRASIPRRPEPLTRTGWAHLLGPVLLIASSRRPAGILSVPVWAVTPLGTVGAHPVWALA